jgi:hypothetical protein
MNNEEIPAATANTLGGFFQTLEQQLSAASASVTDWLKRSMPTTPVASFVGAVLTMIGGITIYCDYTQMVVALSLLFPIGDLASFMALAVVFLTLACGILLHENKPVARRAAVFLFLTLAAFQAYVAYRRTVRTAEVQELVERASDTSDAASTPLTIDGASLDPTPAAQPATARVAPPAISQEGLLSAGLAIILAAASTVTIWQGLDNAGWLLAWLVAGPVWLVFSLPLSAVKLLNGSRWQELLRATLAACFSGVRALGTWLAFQFRRLLIYCSAEARETRAIRRAEAKTRADYLRMVRELQQALRFTVTAEWRKPIETYQAEIAKAVAEQFSDAVKRVAGRAIEGAEKEELRDLPRKLNENMTRYIHEIVSRITINDGYPRAKFQSPAN